MDAESENSEPDKITSANGWFKWNELPFLILMIPVGLFFGWYVSWPAMLIRRWTGVPYLACLIALYSLLLCPFWLRCETEGTTIPLIVTAIVLLTTSAPIMLAGRSEMLDGNNLEHAAPGHMVIVMAYIALPAINAIAEKSA